jgi:hypothetical protein
MEQRITDFGHHPSSTSLHGAGLRADMFFGGPCFTLPPDIGSNSGPRAGWRRTNFARLRAAMRRAPSVTVAKVLKVSQWHNKTQCGNSQ